MAKMWDLYAQIHQKTQSCLWYRASVYPVFSLKIYITFEVCQQVIEPFDVTN